MFLETGISSGYALPIPKKSQRIEISHLIHWITIIIHLFSPHVYANVETRNEAWFSARNVINGNVASSGHGAYPYESWGINQRNDAALTVFFGRPVRINKLFITLRADFPHDNWWKNATISFSDGTNLTLTFAKSGLPQAFEITPRVVDSLTMHDMYADESDPSPFPALTQLEVWGTEAET